MQLSEQSQLDKIRREMDGATFKPKLNKHNDAKAIVPLHTQSLVQSASLGAFSFGGK
jgi:hypothetical protein